MKKQFSALAMFLISSVCAVLSTSSSHAAEYQDVLIEKIPHVQQKPDFCGEACLEMVLRKLGHDISQDDVFNASGTDPALGRGCVTRELAMAMKKLGFASGQIHYVIDPTKADAQLEVQWKTLHADLLKGAPSIICMHTSEDRDATEHFRLITGYDAKSDEVIYHEPAMENGAYRRMRRASLLNLWPLKYAADNWTAIRLRCEPGTIAKPERSPGFSPADFCQHIKELRKRVPAKGFTIFVQPPFVVVGDEDPNMVRTRALRTVKWAVDALRKDYFKKDPPYIIDIWLFKDKNSYERNTFALFEEEPTTPFGFYSEHNRALIMNIETGGGTLIHEIVHPFTRANFPRCPAWFFEGLGSLYEQCADRDGHIMGLTNWRLAGLQEAIRNGSIPTFEQLTSTPDDDFYRYDRGTNYAQARYLCYYLQEKGLLIKFYNRFVSNEDKDPTGYETLKKVLGEDDMAAFEKKWKAFVLKLTFP
jgi:hypothetical protein